MPPNIGFKDLKNQLLDLEEYVKSLDTMTDLEKNLLFSLHNLADGDDIYGERLFTYLLDLTDVGLINSIEADNIYILSIDWPKGKKIEPIPIEEEEIIAEGMAEAEKDEIE